MWQNWLCDNGPGVRAQWVGSGWIAFMGNPLNGLTFVLDPQGLCSEANVVWEDVPGHNGPSIRRAVLPIGWLYQYSGKANTLAFVPYIPPVKVEGQ